MSAVAVPILPAGECPAECRPLALVHDGVFVGLEGEDGLPPCPACLAAVRRALGPSRLTTPLRVRGVERRATGLDDMEPATWDETLERLAFLLAEASRGHRRVLWLSGGTRPRLSQAIARRIGCFAPETTLVRRQPAREITARLLGGLLFADERATGLGPPWPDLVVAWGMDALCGPLEQALALEEALQSGARLIVVDPRASATARSAALHLPLRPGTDAALALGLAERVRQRARGPDIPALLASALAAWPAPRAAEVSGVSPGAIEQAGDWLATAEHPRFIVGGGPARHVDAVAGLHAIAVLARLARATLVGPEPAPDLSFALPLPVGGDGARDVWSGDLDRELKARDPRRDIVIVEGGDPLLEFPAGGELPRFIRQAGFVVTLLDAWSPVCAQSDLVLPVASILERADAHALRWPGTTRATAAALPVRRDALAEPALWRRVARRVGWPEAWFPADLADVARDLGGRTVPPTRASGLPSRWEPPTYREVGEGPRSTPDVFRSYRLFAAWGVPEPATFANPGPVPVVLSASDAAARHIAEGDRVLIHNERGKVRGVARIDAGAPPGIATLPESWTAPELPAPAALLPEQRGGPGETTGPCLVEVGRLA